MTTLPADHLKVYLCPGADPADPDTWDAYKVDITTYVQDPTTIEVGLRDESENTQPSKCTVTVDNRDGRFSPRNPMGPWYGKLGQNTPLMVMWDTDVRFGGMVSEYKPGLLGVVAESRMTLTANGVLRRIQQGEDRLGSALYREMMRRNGTGMVAYWPCEDASGSLSLASALPGRAPMLFSGSPSLSSYSEFLASESLPVCGGTSRFQAGIPGYTTTDETIVRMFVHVPDGGTTGGQELVSIQTTGSGAHWGIVYDTSGGGALRIQVIDSSGDIVLNGTALGFAVDGDQFALSLELIQDGSDVDYKILVVKILPDGSTDTAQNTGTVSGVTVGRVRAVQVARGGALDGVAFGHVAIANEISLFANTTDALLAWRGETAGDRLERLCAEEEIPFQLIGNADDTMPMGAQRSDTALNLLRECAAADLGLFHELEGALVYRTRTSLYNQTPKLELEWCHLRTGIEPTDDDQKLVNEVTVTREGGSSATFADQDHIDKHDRYPNSVTLNVAYDWLLLNIASWMVHLGTVDEMRWPAVPLSLSLDDDLIPDWLTTRVGDRLTAPTEFPQLPGLEIDVLVLGWSETYTAAEWDAVLNCAPASPYNVFALEDDTYGRLGADSSTLKFTVSSSATSLVVNTTLPKDSWSTDSDDWPFDIKVNGEKMTVTSVVNGLNQQTLTVTRAVNGVSKSHAGGSVVELALTTVLAL